MMETVELDFPEWLLLELSREAARLHLSLNEYLGMILYDMKQQCEADPDRWSLYFKEIAERMKR